MGSDTDRIQNKILCVLYSADSTSNLYYKALKKKKKEKKR